MIQIWSFCAGRKPSCGGFFAYVCIEKLAFVDYLRTAQKSIKYMIGVCAYIRTSLLVIWIMSVHLFSKITIRNFCACTQKASTSLLRVCLYAQKIQQMIIIQSSNNPIFDVWRPAQKLQVWNTYIPENPYQ